MPSSLQVKGMKCGGSTPPPGDLEGTGEGCRTRTHGALSCPERTGPQRRLTGSSIPSPIPGFFHTLTDEDRSVYVDNLAAILPPAGKYFMLCFSEREPVGYGPRRITESEIRNSSGPGGRSITSGRQSSRATPGPEGPKHGSRRYQKNDEGVTARVGYNNGCGWMQYTTGPTPRTHSSR